MNTQEIVTLYLKDKETGWAPSTMRSETLRLTSWAEHLDGNPETLWKAIQELAPYTRVTIWTRVSDFWGWAIENGHVPGPNPYKAWRKKNGKRQFKHAYNPKRPDTTFEEAKARIQGLSDSGVRKKALELLYGGLRYTESFTYQPGSKTVVGKGSKRRRVYIPEIPGGSYQGCYRTFLRRLKEIGLTPHVLRKLAATELARRGLREFDLCEVMGWASIETAKIYVAPLREEAMAAVFKDIQGGMTHGEIKVSEPVRKARRVA